MPELPEVETVRRGLERLVRDRTINEVDVYWDKIISNMSPEDFAATILGRQIENIERRAKYLLFRLTGGMTLISHLRMEGSYYTVPRGTELGKHDLVVFHLDADTDLIYRDTRKFGRMTLVPDAEVMQQAGLKTIGPEPTPETLTVDYMVDLFSRYKSRIKPFLLDQSHIAGLGNIYVDECLWQSEIHPETPVNLLTRREIERLHDHIIAEMQRAIALHGTTVHSFTNAYGDAGQFQNELQVYGRAGEPCVRCGTPLIKIKVAQRGTTLCPHDQIKREAADV